MKYLLDSEKLSISFPLFTWMWCGASHDLGKDDISEMVMQNSVNVGDLVLDSLVDGSQLGESCEILNKSIGQLFKQDRDRD